MVEASPQVVVTVTGITGFVGSHVAKVLLENEPTWRVRGTVRNLENAEKINPLKRLLGEDDFAKVELVAANLLDLPSLKQAIAGSTYVIHVASPFVIGEPKDPQTLIGPAVDGTTNVLTACKENGVRRVSITSSVAAISGVSPADAPEVFTEESWSNPEQQVGAYERSKTLAERAAWNFIETQGEGMELTTVCPAFIVGPSTQPEGFASGKVMQMFMNNSFPGGRIPQIQFGVVDVREVATAHIRCIQRDDAQGRRYMLTGESLWFRDIAQILHEKYEPMGYTISTTEAAYCLVRFFGMFSQEAATAAKYWGREFVSDNSRSRDVLGIEYRPAKTSIYEMVDSLIAENHFNKPRQV